MRKIGIMGGTFDPIHIGHLLAAETAREQGDLDEVWFIPTADPPLKEAAPSTPAWDRFEMTRLAVEGDDRFRALDIEIRRGGTSYSYDTVKQLQEQHPGCSFAYIIGSDRINDLPKWHRIGELAAMAGFIGLERPGENPMPDSLPSYLQQSFQMARMPQIGISSTAIRERLFTGKSIRYLVPEPVRDYIRRHGLYGSTTHHGAGPR
ncbi:nicotinate-nucleotide adenylyltransferase [Paenibacillus sp. 1011MAR3C5]|uniref:nicotinate-nucleotide adenylyltransferase n=1 Tax=Paenibacillus sp. 1011MAR3C5 TaxID=1675787 RepID=UPI000E6C6C8D|nr:nicotinate-nucleotide adenylyltransferase [Paenibacillus sp. 1011MAR3C5]RJE90866.1 nicotinate-nucleotide adenylyltransferase [Paenibacillus sp. 1011MAR3C5]